uniref:alanine--glyoxylate transaminase n=1 Tax=Chromera velia CCMP2878 TaxID=1169474 RepID=A0A0G4I6S1_9ALVE|mmetsp:Transcript_21968/g.43586  ORF Transcript_21968/g.43586 Transcript_21968/m.43586 type:complete len:417 (+) Transcript_21968:156-1406(+)|eukprot:Cvel_11476.t1-p1 / transcript=Cvel_11476.t1 / gene=Cvel_11476 / organism=Chromera_velia_CCMP2878 / gene_product=Serine--glyoxylate aminotransferase, putative / transcript_product=Serine--glyoxylate aminotransferase, putative / location=Cvel_scaffold722:53885-55803(+) / protein_length=416 / sequence_SO=supercontig / SO=protein_coding / is_pseudo=false
MSKMNGVHTEPFSYEPPGRYHLFVPGPVNIHERVQKAMSIYGGHNHRDPWFAPFFKGLLEDTKWFFQSTAGHPFIFPGTGTGGWEAALTNTLSPGDKVLTWEFGMFSHLWIDMMERLGLDVEKIPCRWGDGAYEDKMEEALMKDTAKSIKAVCVVHNETATGVTSDLARIRATLDKCGHPALLFVDGVSSIGAVPFKFDEWKIDIAVTGSQKALSIPTGLACLCVSEKAKACMETAKLTRVYFDFRDMIKTNAAGGVPYTPSLPLMYGMKESIAMLKEEGIENVWARHERLAEATRLAVAAWGLRPLCHEKRWLSNALTVVECPEGKDSNAIVKAAYAKHNLSIGLGLGPLNGKAFRIGHLGNMDEIMLLGGLAGVELSLMDVGVPIKPGSGVGAAIEFLQKSGKVIKSRESVIQQ